MYKVFDAYLCSWEDSPFTCKRMQEKLHLKCGFSISRPTEAALANKFHVSAIFLSFSALHCNLTFTF